jgi:hypothetical protein
MYSMAPMANKTSTTTAIPTAIKYHVSCCVSGFGEQMQWIFEKKRCNS